MIDCFCYREIFILPKHELVLYHRKEWLLLS